MSTYKFNLNNVVIDSCDAKKVISYLDKKGSVLCNKSYREIVCNAFLNQQKVTANIYSGNSRGNCIQIYMYCASKVCKRKFKLVQEKLKIIEDSSITFLASSTQENCDHSEKIIRQLRGEERKNIAKTVKDSSVDNYRSEAILRSNSDLLKAGHLQNIHPSPVLRKAVSDYNRENDKHKDAFMDLMLKLDSIESVFSVELKKDKFSVMILSEKQITMLKSFIENCKKQNTISRIHFDATGNITASPHKDIKKLLHHILVIGHKFNESDSTNTFVNVGEFITSLHTSDNLEIFLRRFLQLASQQIKKNG